MEKVRRHLYIEWYYPSHLARRLELMKVLRKNATSLFLNTITIMANRDEIETLEAQIDQLPKLQKAPSIEIVDHPENTRKSYHQFFQIINLTTNHDDINIIANSDIYFNGTIRDANPTSDQCFALARYDVLPDGREVLFNRPDTQDAWIFRGPIREVEGCDFHLGLPGCDNAIAHRLELAGYEVTNPSKTIQIKHLHNEQYHTYSVEKDRVATPYKQIWPTELIMNN